MKLFSKTLLSWSEPFFFVVRTRTRRDWMWKGVWMFLAALVMSGGMVADHFWGKGPGRRMELPVGIALGVLIGIVVVLIHDLVWAQRQVTISEDGISAFANAGTLVSLQQVAFAHILWVHIQRASELQWPFGLLTVYTTGGATCFGLKPSLNVSKLAQIFHDRNIKVQITDWQPKVTSETRREAPTLDEAQALVPPTFASIRIEPIENLDGKRALSRPNLIICNALVLVPFAMAFFVSVGALIYGWWFRDTLDMLPFVEVVGGGILLLVAAVASLPVFGDWAGTRYLHRILRGRILNRPDSLVDPDDSSAHFVDVVPRANWGKVMLCNSSETGFLKVCDSQVLYEGDLERWRIPVDSILGCEVERVLAAGASEGDNAQYRYYVVFQAKSDESLFEAPLSLAPMQIGAPSNRTREQRAHRLRNFLIDALPPQRRDALLAKQPRFSDVTP